MKSQFCLLLSHGVFTRELGGISREIGGISRDIGGTFRKIFLLDLNIIDH